MSIRAARHVSVSACSRVGGYANCMFNDTTKAYTCACNGCPAGGASRAVVCVLSAVQPTSPLATCSGSTERCMLATLCLVLSANTTGVGLKNLTQLGNTSHMQPGASSPDFIWWRTNSELKFKGLWWSTLASGECKAGERPGSSNASCGWRVVEVLSQTSTPRERTDCGHRTVVCRSDGDRRARRAATPTARRAAY